MQGEFLHRGVLFRRKSASGRDRAPGPRLIHPPGLVYPVRQSRSCSHSHVDHFGGVRGIVSEEEVNSGRVNILGLAQFLEHTVSEFVFARNAMTRRPSYMYGTLLPAGPKDQTVRLMNQGYTVVEFEVSSLFDSFDQWFNIVTPTATH